MQGCRRIMLLAGFGLASLAGGCQTPGGAGSSGVGGPSPSFGLHAPAQSEPPLEDAGAGRKVASRSSGASASVDDNDTSRATASRRSSWLPGGDKEPPKSKPLPVSDRTESSADDDDL